MEDEERHYSFSLYLFCSMWCSLCPVCLLPRVFLLLNLHPLLFCLSLSFSLSLPCLFFFFSFALLPFHLRPGVRLPWRQRNPSVVGVDGWGECGITCYNPPGRRNKARREGQTETASDSSKRKAQRTQGQNEDDATSVDWSQTRRYMTESWQTKITPSQKQRWWFELHIV